MQRIIAQITALIAIMISVCCMERNDKYAQKTYTSTVTTQANPLLKHTRGMEYYSNLQARLDAAAKNNSAQPPKKFPATISKLVCLKP
jgi:uncharacterized Fe-S cluster-containing protein